MSGEEKALAISLRKQGFPVWYVAKKMNCTPHTILNHTKELKKNYRWWSEDEIAKLIELKEQGKSFRQAAKILGRNPSSCHRRYVLCAGNTSKNV